MGNSRHTASTFVLDDDSLLHVFYLSRPFFREEDGSAEWRYNGRWWYALAHVCRRWRNIVLGSATYLDLTLLCTYGTPVADMLAHSPPLPIVVGYFRIDRLITAEDEEGIIHALKQRNRVRRVRLYTVFTLGTILEKFVATMDEDYPSLEYLYITLPLEDHRILRFPGTLQAPNLRHLTLQGFALTVGSRLLTTAAPVGLVTLHLVMLHPSTYFHPNTLLQWISLMPQLETLTIYLKYSILTREVERLLSQMPIIAPIAAPNLRHFNFRGVSPYLEALVHRFTTPLLEKLTIELFTQLTYFVPSLLQFINATENLRFDHAVISFSRERVDAVVYSHGETKVPSLNIVVNCRHFFSQAFSMGQIFESLGQIFSEVDHLVLQHRVINESSEWRQEVYVWVDRTQWRILLRPFGNVKTLCIRAQHGIDFGLSQCLKLEDGELPIGLLPNLHELEYYGYDTGDAFTSFIDARRKAGCPVTLVRSSSQRSSEPSSDVSAISSANIEDGNT